MTVTREVARQVRLPLSCYTVAVVARTTAGVATPALVATTVDAVLRRASVTGPLTVLAAVLFATAVAEIAGSLLAARVTGTGTARLQIRTVRHVLGVSRPTVAPGDAVARIVHAAGDAAGAPVAAVGGIVTAAGSVAGLVLLWIIDPWAGLAFTVSAPVAVVLARRFFGDIGRVQGDYLTAQSRIAARLVTALGGIRTIRAAGTVAEETSRVLQPRPDLTAAGRALWSVQRGAIWRLNLLLAAVELVTVAVAGLGVAAGRVEPGTLVAVIGYVAIAMGGFDQIDTLLGLGQARAAATRVSELLDGTTRRVGVRRLPAGPGALRLRDVGLHTRGGPVLTGIDLDIPGGTSVAVVSADPAEAGALATLVGGLVEPDRGEITLDGVPIPELVQADLRAAIGYAFAVPVLTGDTVADAIGYGPTTTPADRIRGAARAAEADGFIRRLPDGYDTPLARAPMSGGELQRVGLARALARDARLHVLDDATSGLDAATAAAVRRTLATSFAGRTRVVVANRADTAADCDVVAWLDRGRLRAVAPHHELWLHADYRAAFGPECDPPGGDRSDKEAIGCTA